VLTKVNTSRAPHNDNKCVTDPFIKGFGINHADTHTEEITASSLYRQIIISQWHKRKENKRYFGNASEFISQRGKQNE